MPLHLRFLTRGQFHQSVGFQLRKCEPCFRSFDAFFQELNWIVDFVQMKVQLQCRVLVQSNVEIRFRRTQSYDHMSFLLAIDVQPAESHAVSALSATMSAVLVSDWTMAGSITAIAWRCKVFFPFGQI
jgi:hypothetical protein